MECLITGIKGFGKTAHALDLVFVQDSEFKGMSVYVEGIAFTDSGHLRCPHFDFPLISDLKKPGFIPCVTVDADDDEADKYKPWLPSHFEYQDFIEARATAKHPIELWFLWAQKNSVIFIDEAQRFYRPRPSGAKVPLHIRMIEYARHFGIHFVFISQAPRFIDINLRAHIEKHIHLDKTWKGGLKFESVGCMDIESKADRKDAVKSAYSPPKHIFPFYVSSSLHLKVKHKIPFVVKSLVVVIPLFAFLVWFLVNKVHDDHFGKKSSAENTVAVSGAINNVAVSGVPSFDSVSGVVEVGQFSEGKIKKFIADFSPLVPGVPESAPAYDSLRKVVSMPRIAACLQRVDVCVCYSQQASRLVDVNDLRCRQIVSNGQSFDPYNVSDKPHFNASKVSDAAVPVPAPVSVVASSNNSGPSKWQSPVNALIADHAPYL